MKSNQIVLISFLFLSFTAFSQNQKTESIKYPDNVNAPLTTKEKTMIDEVYQTSANERVYKNEAVLKSIKHLLRNRITIYKDSNPETQKKSKMLSQIPLFNDYNSNLKRDTNFNIETFNPLKYKFDFFSKGTYVYRIDNTDYFIQITSQYRRTYN